MCVDIIPIICIIAIILCINNFLLLPSQFIEMIL